MLCKRMFVLSGQGETVKAQMHQNKQRRSLEEEEGDREDLKFMTGGVAEGGVWGLLSWAGCEGQEVRDVWNATPRGREFWGN